MLSFCIAAKRVIFGRIPEPHDRPLTFTHSPTPIAAGQVASGLLARPLRLAVGSAVVAATICWMLARMTPSWYMPLDPADDNVMRLAGRAQNLLYFELRNAAERVPLGAQRWTITQMRSTVFWP